MKKTSVIILGFNRFDFLRRALLCMQNQSHLVDQVVISDDGSSDEILGQLKNIAKDLTFQIKYIREECFGVALINFMER